MVQCSFSIFAKLLIKHISLTEGVVVYKCKLVQNKTSPSFCMVHLYFNRHERVRTAKAAAESLGVSLRYSDRIYTCIPKKRGYYGSCMVIVWVRIRRDFLVVNLQATFSFGFFLNKAGAFICLRSLHHILSVGLEKQMSSRE